MRNGAGTSLSLFVVLAWLVGVPAPDPAPAPTPELASSAVTPSPPAGSAPTPRPGTPPPLPREIPEETPPAPTAMPATFTILAGGDVLPHGPVNASAARGGRVDYSPLLAGIDAWVGGADLALCHLEVPVAPPGSAATGYPLFGAPAELVADLREQGWDGCSTASNHSVDRGFRGVVSTLDALDAAGMGHAGTARTAEEQSLPQLYDLHRSGRWITVAHLAVTYGLNGLPMPAEAPWAVDLIDVDRVVAQTAAARAAGADVVVVSVHDGAEYTQEPTAHQRDVAVRLAASGQVDLVLGHHAHVPQPVELLPGGRDGLGLWVAYGLGNLLSNQNPGCCGLRSTSGLLLTATVTQEPHGPARVTGVGWTATTVDLAAGHRLRTIAGAPADPAAGRLSEAQLHERQELVRTAAGPQALELVAPPTPTGEAPLVVRRP